ncbi:MAG: 7-carboxy-7-deazaguanine synthase QueE [Phycisphaerales bacterium]|jgi:7-carboxy-7-deazaguanine synthase
MVVNEIFYSLQGEGFLAGVPSVFIRLAGCPLRCIWCDTKYAWDEEGREFSIEQIIEETRKWQCKNIVITGGEPFVQSGLSGLVQKLKSPVNHITIETAGIDFLPDLACDLMSISPKTSNAGTEQIDIKVLQQFINAYDYQLKFVIDEESDIDEVKTTLAKLPGVNRDKVMLMPQAATRGQYIEKAPVVAELCIKNGFAFSPRLQVMLWNNKPGR